MAAKMLSERYLSAKSALEINVDAKTKKSTLEYFKQAFDTSVPNHEELHHERKLCFEECKIEILKLLEDVYRKFRLNYIHEKMRADLEGMRVRYSSC